MILRLAVVVAAALACIPALAAQPPQRVELDFTVEANSMDIGEGRDVLEHDGKTYRIASELKTVGVAAVIYKLDIRRNANGLVTPEGLQPLHFEETRTKKAPKAVDFDWKARTVKLTDGDKVQTLPLPENTFDQTSFAYAFAFQEWPDKMPTIYLTDGRKLSDYDYRTLGREKLKTPIGEIETLHVKKIQDADDKRGFEVWLSLQHHNLPVRIRYVEKNGQVVDSTITRISYQ